MVSFRLALSNPTLPEITDGYEIQLHHSPGHDLSVGIKSVIFLNEKTAAVRFSTTRNSSTGPTETNHWVANVRFKYTSEPMRNDWRFDNPLGFQVTEYRRDQETVTSTEDRP